MHRPRVQGRSTARGRVPLDGGSSTEGAERHRDGRRGTGQERRGGVRTSYLQVVTFDDRGPVADALLTYGQSSLPDSPHAFDQLARFPRKEMQRLPFHPEDVARQRAGEVLRLDVR
jgi:acyl-homoserine-lactone acylase